jgi:hypothetical protein
VSITFLKTPEKVFFTRISQLPAYRQDGFTRMCSSEIRVHPCLSADLTAVRQAGLLLSVCIRAKKYFFSTLFLSLTGLLEYYIILHQPK